MPEIKPEIETLAKIKVVGVGGSGGSAVNRMIRSGIKGIEFIAVNTDMQALHHNQAKHKLHIGQTTTKGLGAGMNPDMGLMAAQESINEIRDLLKDANMVFITCGLGGGTGTGAAPVVAAVAKELGALVVAVVTKPFSFEGAQRSAIADRGYKELKDRVDTIITIPNDKILQIVDKKTSLLDAFQTVDDVLRQGVQGISEIITIPALINIDFADVKTIMQDAGSALMGIGEASGDNRATLAAKLAVSSPLLDISIDGARGILFVITGGSNLSMSEVNEAATVITESADPNAKIIFGASIDDNLKDKVRITVVATGFGDMDMSGRSSAMSLEDPKYSLNRLFTQRSVSTDDNRRPAVRSERRDERPERREEPVSLRPAAPSAPAPISRPAKPVVEEDDDLEIPAFLRRKMK
ncbi:MAG: cell division protein FtsZ [Candidatus Buchananbacteria bacterium]|nr:cell division protein FtsZ [Candidatus Buchananbacteria bacterium]